jgi:signal peptidase
MRISSRRFATLRRVCDSLLITLILVVLFGMILGRLVPLTGRTTLIIGGNSMQPTIPIGAAVIVEPVAPAAIQVGDVVSLRTGAHLQSVFTHRVTRVVDRDGVPWIETKGDANATADPSLTSTSQVIGRATTTIPYAGFLLALLSIPSGVLLVLFLAGVLLSLTWLLESFEVDLIAQVPEPAEPAPSSPTASANPRAARAHRLRRARESALDPAGRGD